MWNRLIILATIFTKKSIFYKSMEKNILVQTKAQLIKRQTLNHDTYIFTFKFDGPIINFSIGKHFIFKQFLKTWQYPEGEELIRKYTPISPCSQKQTMDVLIKIYRPNQNPNFPNGGKLTPYIQNLKIGESLNVEGPRGRFQYTRGLVTIDDQTFPVKRLVLIAGGSGITPIYQVITQIAKDKQDSIQLVVLFANKTQQDIVLRKELDALKYRVKIYYMIDKAKQGWTGLTGYVTKDVLQKVCGSIEDADTLYCHCGPFLMNQSVRKILSVNKNTKIFKF